MVKLKTLQSILQKRIIAVVRAPATDDALKMAQACIEGGVTTLEISFTTPDALDIIKTLCQRHGDEALIGVGTVLDSETVRLAILAGARFILSPSVDAGVIRTCNRYQVVSMPGAATATEIMTALEAGADIVKIFPGDVFGPGYLKALRAPLPQVPLMPSGGVSLENVEAWFANGAVAVGVGSSLTSPGTRGDYAGVAANARAFVQAIDRIGR